MPLKYLIDENLRGKFAHALVAKGLAENLLVDLLEVGEEGAPPLGTKDDELLRWAQANSRILVSLDKNTLPEFLQNHLASGASSSGVVLIRRTHTWDEIIHYLVLFAETITPEECANQCIYIPL